MTSAQYISFSEEIINSIVEICKQKKISKEDLSALAMIDRREIDKIFNNNRPIKLNELSNILRGLDTSLYDFFKDLETKEGN